LPRRQAETLATIFPLPILPKDVILHGQVKKGMMPMEVFGWSALHAQPPVLGAYAIGKPNAWEDGTGFIQGKEISGGGWNLLTNTITIAKDRKTTITRK